MSAVDWAVGVELRSARERCGLTRRVVMQRVSSGLSAQALANWERGIRPCPLVQLVELCVVLGVSVVDVVGAAVQRAAVTSCGGE